MILCWPEWVRSVSASALQPAHSWLDLSVSSLLSLVTDLGPWSSSGLNIPLKNGFDFVKVLFTLYQEEPKLYIIAWNLFFHASSGKELDLNISKGFPVILICMWFLRLSLKFFVLLLCIPALTSSAPPHDHCGVSRRGLWRTLWTLQGRRRRASLSPPPGPWPPASVTSAFSSLRRPWARRDCWSPPLSAQCSLAQTAGKKTFIKKMSVFFWFNIQRELDT